MKFKLLLFLSLLSFNISAQDLYDLNTLRTINLSFQNPDWHQNLVDGWFEQSGHREPATLEMDGVSYSDVAIRYKGNATFFIGNDIGNPKLPLNIDMDDLVQGQDLLGYSKVKLANAMFDPTILRDVLGFKIYRDYMPAPEANWLKVNIDSQYIGLYPNTESINKPFLEKHFDYKDGVLFKCDPTAQFGTMDPWFSPDLAWYGPDSAAYMERYDLKTDYGWAELIHLMDVLNNNPDELHTILNIDRVLWNLAVSTVIANYDSYNGLYIHNYYLYLHENGLFQMMPWDVSESFIGILLGNDFLTPDDLYNWDIFLENDPFGEDRALLEFVRDNPLYRKQYVAHIRTVTEEVLDIPTLTNAVEEMNAFIEDAAVLDTNYFLGIGPWFFDHNVTQDVNFFGLQIAGILSAASKRKEYLTNHPEVSLIPPTISDVSRSSDAPTHNEIVTVTATVENADLVDLMVTKNQYASHFEAVEMFDDGMHNDGSAGDGIYGAQVPYDDADDHIKYYIRAQNSDAMMLAPQRAEYEFHEYTVGGVNSVFNKDSNLPNLEISPNPSDGTFYIQNADNQLVKIEKVEVFNMIGQQIQNAETEYIAGRYILNLSSLSNGIYLLKAEGFAPEKVMILR